VINCPTAEQGQCKSGGREFNPNRNGEHWQSCAALSQKASWSNLFLQLMSTWNGEIYKHLD